MNVMHPEGYIFTRIGVPDPSQNDYYLQGGVMIEAKNWAGSSEPASIYQRMEDYFGRTKNQS